MPLTKTTSSLASRKTALEQRLKKLREKIRTVSDESKNLQKGVRAIEKNSTLTNDAKKLTAVRKKLGLK